MCLIVVAAIERDPNPVLFGRLSLEQLENTLKSHDSTQRLGRQSHSGIEDSIEAAKADAKIVRKPIDRDRTTGVGYQVNRVRESIVEPSRLEHLTQNLFKAPHAFHVCRRIRDPRMEFHSDRTPDRFERNDSAGYLALWYRQERIRAARPKSNSQDPHSSRRLDQQMTAHLSNEQSSRLPGLRSVVVMLIERICQMKHHFRAAVRQYPLRTMLMLCRALERPNALDEFVERRIRIEFFVAHEVRQ